MNNRRGFTLIEVMVTAGVSLIAIAAAFALARFQIRAYAAQGDVSRMQTSARIVFDSLARDLRNAGFGTTFYAGAPTTAFADRLAFRRGSTFSRGIPAIRIANNATGPTGGPGAGVMVGSDAITLLRVESVSTYIPNVGSGVRPIPASFNPNAESFVVADPSVLQRCGDEGLLALVSDLTTGEPASTLLPLDRVTGAVAGQPGPIRFVAQYGIDPALAGRVSDGSSPPGGMPPGSLVTCVRPVTYWLDNLGRLRLWRARPDPAGGATTSIIGGVSSTPIDPDNDMVLVEGIEELQIALFMSTNFAARPTDGWLLDGGTGAITNDSDLAEVRAVRMTAVVRTPRKDDATFAINRPVQIEDGPAHSNRVVGCTASDCYDPRFHRKVVSFESELRSLRVFDMLSTQARTTDQLWSYSQ